MGRPGVPAAAVGNLGFCAEARAKQSTRLIDCFKAGNRHTPNVAGVHVGMSLPGPDRRLRTSLPPVGFGPIASAIVK